MIARRRFRRAMPRLSLAVVLAAVLGPLLLTRPFPRTPSETGAPPHAPAPPPPGAAVPAAIEATRWVMGTALRVVIVPPAGDATAALEAVFDQAQRVDALLSDYDPASALSRLNAGAGVPTPIEPDLRAYLVRALRDSERTEGAFDITVGALTWVYRMAASAPGHDAGAPPPRVLAAARACVGYSRVRIAALDSVELPAGMRLDPGGDGKGVAVDAMVRELRARDVRNAFLDFGRSSVYGMGVPEEGAAGWDVLLEGDRGRPLGIVTLRDVGLSTSTSLRSDAGGGAPRGHIVDPRTGGLVVVARTAAVLSASGTEGDVLSTALVVEGHRGLRWLERFPGAAAAVFEGTAPDSSAGRTAWVQPAFARRFRAAFSSRSRAARCPGPPACRRGSASSGSRRRHHKWR